jgi:hypothetical protein
MAQALEPEDEKDRGQQVAEFDEVGLPVHFGCRPEGPSVNSHARKGVDRVVIKTGERRRCGAR